MTASVPYVVEKTIESIEIRRYPMILLATVHGLSHNEAFGLLFDYISGNNRTKRKIEMTVPVISSEKIRMTAPVISSKSSFSFVLPSEYAMDTIPEPLDPRVVLDEVPMRKLAVLRFRGRATARQVGSRSSELVAILGSAGVESKSNPFLMRYNPPFMPGFLRRNEVAVEVVSDG